MCLVGVKRVLHCVCSTVTHAPFTCRNITCSEDHFATSEDNTILYYVPTTTCHIILTSYIKNKNKKVMLMVLLLK